MEDLALPEREPKAAREKRTALLAGAAAMFLSVPLLSLALKRWETIVPDQDEGFTPIAQISGRARETPQITLELPKAEPLLASVISLPLSAPRAARPPLPRAVKRAPPVTSAKKRLAARPAKKTTPARLPAPKKAAPPLAVAPPPFARPSDFYELEFPVSPAAAPAVQRPTRPALALEPVAVPDFFEPPAAKTAAARGPAVIIERVPSNDR